MINIPTSSWRVKVYELSNDEWIDKGTGYCTGDLVNPHDSLNADTNNFNAYTGISDLVPMITVRNEDNDKDILLQSTIFGDTQYQKQQETLIVWSEPASTDMALSFQESEGCSVLCDFLINIQRKYVPGISLVALHASLDGTSDTTELIAGPLNLPTDQPSLANLPQLLESINQCSQSHYGRDKLINYLIQADYVTKVMALFETAEDLESINDLHLLCKISKSLFLLNDNNIIETFLTEENIMPFFGSLEYDPGFAPNFKANHREYLDKHSEFKQVIPIKSKIIVNKIKETFRLLFLKDVVFAKILDDASFALLSSLIYYNQTDIISWIHDNDEFSETLFNLYKPTIKKTSKDTFVEVSLDQQREGIKFIFQCLLISKNLQLSQRTSLYNKFIRNGLFTAIIFALQDRKREIRGLGTELIVSIIDHDTFLVRGYKDTNMVGNIMGEELIDDNETIVEQNGNQNDDSPMTAPVTGLLITKILIKLLLNETNSSMKSQVFEALKVLLDTTPTGMAELSSRGMMENCSRSQQGFLINEEYIDAMYYEGIIATLFQPLADIVAPLNSNKDSRNNKENETDLNQSTNGYLNNQSKEFTDLVKTRILAIDFSKRELFEYLCTLLIFCAKTHRVPCRSYIEENGLWNTMASIAKYATNKPSLRVIAIGGLKAALSLNDEFHNRNLIQYQVFSPVFVVLQELGNRNNLLHSACLEILDSIRVGSISAGTTLMITPSSISSKNPMQMILRHVVENYRVELERLSTYCKVGDELITCYEALQRTNSANGGGSSINSGFTSDSLSISQSTLPADEPSLAKPVDDADIFDDEEDDDDEDEDEEEEEDEGEEEEDDEGEARGGGKEVREEKGEKNKRDDEEATNNEIDKGDNTITPPGVSEFISSLLRNRTNTPRQLSSEALTATIINKVSNTISTTTPTLPEGLKKVPTREVSLVNYGFDDEESHDMVEVDNPKEDDNNNDSVKNQSNLVNEDNDSDDMFASDDDNDNNHNDNISQTKTEKDDNIQVDIVMGNSTPPESHEGKDSNNEEDELESKVDTEDKLVAKDQTLNNYGMNNNTITTMDNDGDIEVGVDENKVNEVPPFLSEKRAAELSSNNHNSEVEYGLESDDMDIEETSPSKRLKRAESTEDEGLDSALSLVTTADTSNDTHEAIHLLPQTEPHKQNIADSTQEMILGSSSPLSASEHDTNPQESPSRLLSLGKVGLLDLSQSSPPKATAGRLATSPLASSSSNFNSHANVSSSPVMKRRLNVSPSSGVTKSPKKSTPSEHLNMNMNVMMTLAGKRFADSLAKTTPKTALINGKTGNHGADKGENENLH